MAFRLPPPSNIDAAELPFADLVGIESEEKLGLIDDETICAYAQKIIEADIAYYRSGISYETYIALCTAAEEDACVVGRFWLEMLQEWYRHPRHDEMAPFSFDSPLERRRAVWTLVSLHD